MEVFASLCRDYLLASPTPEGRQRFLLIQEEISVDKTYVRVHYKFLRVREVDLHLPQCLSVPHYKPKKT